MTKITLTEAIAHIDALIAGTETRKEVANWAEKIVLADDVETRIYEPASDETIILEIVDYLYSADIQNAAGMYFRDLDEYVKFRKGLNIPYCQEVKKQDITKSFKLAIATATHCGWNEEKAIKLMRDVNKCFSNSRLDWDSSVPEQWGCCIIRSDSEGLSHVVAAILVSAPLIMVKKELRNNLHNIEKFYPVVVCQFQDWDCPNLSIERNVLEQHFRADLSRDPIDFSSMSMGDLYFSTVTI